MSQFPNKPQKKKKNIRKKKMKQKLISTIQRIQKVFFFVILTKESQFPNKQKRKRKEKLMECKGWLADSVVNEQRNKTEKVGRWKCDQTTGLPLLCAHVSTTCVESWVFHRRRKCKGSTCCSALPSSQVSRTNRDH